MALQIMLRLPDGSTSVRTYENAYALINARTRFLEVYRNKVLIASFHELGIEAHFCTETLSAAQ